MAGSTNQFARLTEPLNACVMDDRPQSRRILILEPDAQQAQQLAAGFPSESPAAVITIAEPEQAVEFLQQKGQFANAVRPDLILLSFPPAQSQTILQLIKGDRQLRQIPVILLNQTDDARVVLDSYIAQGNCYVLKSARGDDLTALAQRIESFWLGIVTLPQH
jgi:chemotaxis family two-component system response regulator Rcp1